MSRYAISWTTIALFGIVPSGLGAQEPSAKNEPDETAFARLAGSDPGGIYKGSEHLAQAGKKNAAIAPRLAKMMWDTSLSETSRYWALRTLAEIGPNAKAVLPDLVKAMDGADPYFRIKGSLAILRVGGPTEKPLATLKTLARDKSGLVRMESVSALGDAGPLAKDALPLLVDILGDPNNTERIEAARAVGNFGPAAKEAVSALAAILDDRNERLREAAVHSWVGCSAMFRKPSIRF